MNKFKYLKISNTKKIRYLSQNYNNNLYIIFLHGFSGGFMLLVTREPDARAAVEAARVGEPVTVHAVAIHENGLQTRVG